jgi:nicotinamidase-related amidase
MENILKKESLAFIIVDMLNHFSTDGDEGYSDRFNTIVNNISRLRDFCHLENIPVIYVYSSYSSAEEYFQSGLAKKYPPHAIQGTYDAEVIANLAPTKNDIIVTKTTNSGFFNTKLDSVLKNLKRNTLLFAGVHTHVCVLLTVADANYRNYDTIAISDCVASSTLERHNFGLGYIERHFGSSMTSNNLIDLLTTQSE